MKYILLYLLSAAVLLLCGCQNTDAPEDISEKAQTTYITAAAPADGWTWDDINRLIYINGTRITYPFSVAMLGSDYELGKLGAGNYYVGGLVYSGGKQLFSVRYYIESVDDFAKLSVYSDAAGIMFSSGINESDIPDEEICAVNGVTLGMSYEQLVEKMGEPDIDNAGAYFYNVGETGIEFRVSDNAINLISVYWE